MVKTITVNSAKEAYEYIKTDHKQRCKNKDINTPLKFGVGNDMTTPFYTNRYLNQYEWWPIVLTEN